MLQPLLFVANRRGPNNDRGHSVLLTEYTPVKPTCSLEAGISTDRIASASGRMLAGQQSAYRRSVCDYRFSSFVHLTPAVLALCPSHTRARSSSTLPEAHTTPPIRAKVDVAGPKLRLAHATLPFPQHQ
jgi:hypothetical protein